MQIFLPDNLPSLVRASVNSLTLASTNALLPTTVTLGGQQYAVPSALTLSTLSVGANGLDAGSLGTVQLWYVYAIVHQSTLAVALLASLVAPSANPVYPSGYGTVKKLVGAFYTDGSSQVGSVVTIIGQATTDWMQHAPNVIAVTTNPTYGAGGYTLGRWRRISSGMECYVQYIQTAAGAAGSGIYGFTLPTGYTVNSIGTTYASAGAIGVVGTAAMSPGGTAPMLTGVVRIYSDFTTGVVLVVGNDTVAPDWFSSASALNFGSTSLRISASFIVPIVGWSNTLL